MFKQPGQQRATRLRPFRPSRQTIAPSTWEAQGRRHLAYYDPLTTLPNRTLLTYRLGQALQSARARKKVVAVLRLSLDPYKRINETLGPAMGDRLVRFAAKRLRLIMRPQDTIGYWGGDEFALLVHDLDNAAQVADIVQNIQQRFDPRFISNNYEFYITSSIGVATYPLNGLECETLMKNAGAAMFRAKEAGGNGFRFYTADMSTRALQRLNLENRLRRALKRGEFTVHYQPRINDGSWQIVGAEALARWEQPELGVISPADFIPLAEETGMIGAIGEWILKAACRQLKRWHADGFPDLHLSVNISACQFQGQDLAESIMRILNEIRLDPKYLELELTESSIIENGQHVVTALGKLKDVGIKLSIDDFGTGFSSLQYLRRLPLDTLKIDRSFVRDASNNLDGAALVLAIITLAHKLKLKVVAEGVESEDQLRLLHGLGCDGMQGYLFSKPLPADQFRRLLASADYKLKDRPTGSADRFHTAVSGVEISSAPRHSHNSTRPKANS